MTRSNKRDNILFSEIVAFLKANKSLMVGVVLLGIIADTFFVENSSDIRIFGILGLSIFNVIFYKISSKFIFSLCLGLLILMFLQFIFSGTSIATEKSAVWFVLFFAIGLFRQWNEK